MHDHTPEDETRRNAPESGGAVPRGPEDAAGPSPDAAVAPPHEGIDPGWPPPVSPGPETQPGIPGGPRLMLWLVILLGTGAASLVFQLQEAAILIALSGLFVAAQAADLYPDRRYLYSVVSWTVPVIGFLVFVAIGYVAAQSEADPLQTLVIAFSAAAALMSLATLLRPVSDSITRLLFRGGQPSHALRLTSRLVLMGLMLAFPGWYAFRDTFEEMLASGTSLFEQGFIGSGLLGYVVLAFAAVGFMVRRGAPDTLERLGLRPLRPGDWAVVPLGVIALFGLNLALEALQRTWFTDMWLSDQRVSQMIAAELGPAQILLLGLSAGIGEEITLRGALQPRLGVVLTSLLFAALHVQYSWFGMGVIFCFGLLLGYMRVWTSTTVVMAVHTLYDIVAVVSMPGPT